MRRWLLVVPLVLGACGSHAAPDAATPVPVRHPPATPAPARGVHGAAITVVVLTADGDAAVTADQFGGIRLWPTLDGTREPFAITASQARGLAVLRDGNGFVVGVLDAAGGVELIRLTAEGVVTHRAMLAGEMRIRQLESTAHGVLVLREDQTIALVDLSARVLAELAPPPGTRVESLVVRGDQALAVLDDGTVHARAIELAASTATWGVTTPALPIDPRRPVVLSPDRVTIAAFAQDQRVVFVSLETGRIAKQGACPTAPLGFYDATTLVCTDNGVLVWWSTTGASLAPPPPNPAAVGAPMAIAEHRLAVGIGQQLGLFTPTSAHYLGYGFRELVQARTSAAGMLIGKGDQQPQLLDAHLRGVSRMSLPPATSRWTDVLPLDARYVLTVAEQPQRSDAWGNGYQVAVHDTIEHAAHQTLPYRARDSELTYEPTTRLLATSDGASTLLLRLDPATHTFGERIEVVTPRMIERVYLVDPALADGMIALAVSDDGARVAVLEVYESDLASLRITPRREYAVAGQLDAVDRAGRLYVRAHPRSPDLVVYEHGAVRTMLAGAGPLTARPSPDGTQVALVGDSRIELRTLDGTTAWSVAAWGATDATWTSGGQLVARYGGALARLDLASGTLVERQCGWELGLADQPFPTTADAPNVCDVAP